MRAFLYFCGVAIKKNYGIQPRQPYQRYINVQQIVMDHYDPDVTTYAGIWRKYVLPVYPMTYKRFIEIINMPRLKEQLAVERAKKNPVAANQLDLFTDDGSPA